jgi:hypothetical protein
MIVEDFVSDRPKILHDRKQGAGLASRLGAVRPANQKRDI